MSGFKLMRLGMVMEPEPGNPHEVEGTLNPGAARGPDGALYLFPRLVARGNYSRIGPTAEAAARTRASRL
jgi:beta-1,2-mannobiose phosphorylase / 1,2-beta-oligomannan phosphorylase